ncbi:MAG TPA: hypothetical protein VFI65_23215 [Streptosporangiaceae bacterium]|nr:hypothetical protein [Streptosporangiaceae bacterium]
MREPDEAVEVLRGVWSANGQSVADLDERFGEPKACKRMADVNFDGYSESSDGDDLRAAWRQTLERDGKLGGEGSVRDLVLGQGRPAQRDS